MAGKEGVFQVSVKEVRRRLPAAVDDTLAEAVGLESLDELRQEIRQRMQRDYDNVARQRLKRALLDRLADATIFWFPPAWSTWSSIRSGSNTRASARRAGRSRRGPTEQQNERPRDRCPARGRSTVAM